MPQGQSPLFDELMECPLTNFCHHQIISRLCERVPVSVAETACS